VVNHRVWAPSSERHLESLHDQLAAQVVGHGPTHHPPAPSVHNDGQVQGTCPGRDVRDTCTCSAGASVSATQSTFGLATAKSRSTRSGAGLAPACRMVVRGRLRRLTPCNPAACIRRATRFRPTRMPSSASSAWMRGAP
jgi:hypothetical protein